MFGRHGCGIAVAFCLGVIAGFATGFLLGYSIELYADAR
jgi:hypothetical protein